jgi:hypothetical protein
VILDTTSSIGISSESDCGSEFVAYGLSAVQLTEACFGFTSTYGLGGDWKASGGSK